MKISYLVAAPILLLLASFSVHSMDLLAIVEGRNAIEEDTYSEGSNDLDGDGFAEILTAAGFNEGMVLSATKLDGTTLWTLSLAKDDFCPTCTDQWEWWKESFGDVDPTPGRELIVQWYDYNTDQTGAGVIAPTYPSSGTIIENLVGGDPEMVLDLNGDGSEEILVEFDDSGHVEIWGYIAASGVEAGPAGSIPRGLSLRSDPNPALEGVSLRYTLDRPADAGILVFTPDGRLVRTFHEGPKGSGRHSVRWDGHDDAGRRMGAGVYFFVLRADGEMRGREKVTLMR
jgi:hypothetical protein